MFRRDLEPFALPQPFDTLVVDLPAGLTKQRSDTAVAISTILPRQFDHVGDKTLLILASSGDEALCRTVLAEHATGTAFGDVETVTHPIDAVASA